MGLRPAGGDADRRHDPGHEPDRDRHLARERARRAPRTRTATRRPRFTYWYQPATRDTATCTFTNTGATRCFEPYNLAAPPAPADIASFTNDRGDTVKSIVRVERGTLNRGIYELATLYDPTLVDDPTQPNTPWPAQKGWNGKLYWIYGASSGVSRFQTPPGGTTVWNNTALRRGFMVAASSLTDHGTNANDTLAAETMMMVKERIAETYGPIRYTMGAGCSGGSIMQLNIAAAYPGLLNGIQPNCTYPDTFTTAIEVMECGLLGARYYTTPNGSLLTTDQRNAINGHAGQGFCAAWNGAFLPSFNPAGSGNCGAGWPAALTFDKLLRPQGIRCTAADHDAAMFGKTTGAGRDHARQLAARQQRHPVRAEGAPGRRDQRRGVHAAERGRRQLHPGLRVGAARPCRGIAARAEDGLHGRDRQRRQAAREDRDHRSPRQPGGGRDPHELACLVGPRAARQGERATTTTR